MADDDYKKYTESTRRGIKGEAFFESLVVDHAIPHCIARQNDLGIDFLYKTNRTPCIILANWSQGTGRRSRQRVNG
jgi:hypothetical protein